uniref:Uncharacterized protein n=1 Tax=Globisporangium ultimum (strain ATCC 200006 / CBS 805.95 / DAOM BR144) TaxID=431595 RepID=K3XC03_GLOUD
MQSASPKCMTIFSRHTNRMSTMGEDAFCKKLACCKIPNFPRLPTRKKKRSK